MFPIVSLLPSIGQFFSGLVSRRNTDLQLIKNEQLEQRRHTISKEIAELQAQNVTKLRSVIPANQILLGGNPQSGV